MENVDGVEEKNKREKIGLERGMGGLLNQMTARSFLMDKE